jgi:homoserine kinase
MPLSVRVPASTSNLGAGFDCLGLALDLWLTATVAHEPGEPVYAGTAQRLQPARDLIFRTVSPLLGGRRLRVSSDIPIGRGLGSSAAALVAGAALAQLLRGEPLDRDAAFRHAANVEGHPDNAAPAAYGGLILAAERPTRLTLHASLAVALAVPDAGLSTHKARAILPGQVPRETAIAQAARAAALVQGLVTGDGALVTFGMEDQLAVPQRRHLIAGYDVAAAAGREAGALGVTISGAGSSLLALCSPADASRVARAMAESLTACGNRADPLTPSVALAGLT